MKRLTNMSRPAKPEIPGSNPGRRTKQTKIYLVLNTSNRCNLFRCTIFYHENVFGMQIPQSRFDRVRNANALGVSDKTVGRCNNAMPINSINMQASYTVFVGLELSKGLTSMG